MVIAKFSYRATVVSVQIVQPRNCRDALLGTARDGPSLTL